MNAKLEGKIKSHRFDEGILQEVIFILGLTPPEERRIQFCRSDKKGTQFFGRKPDGYSTGVSDDFYLLNDDLTNPKYRYTATYDPETYNFTIKDSKSPNLQATYSLRD